MNVILCITFLAIAQPKYQDREPHPLAPSLPRLTKEECAKFDAIIERFIQYDIGKLKGADGKKALDDFNRLGSESIFNLIDGLNRAANMESSCPAVIIARKVAKIITTSDDLQLLTFAKENIGAGVTAKRHVGVLKDLQANILLRRGFLQRQALAQGGNKAIGSMSLVELESAISKGSGSQLKGLLTEAEKRTGAKAVDLLVMGLMNKDTEIVKLSQGLLSKNLQRQPNDVLKSLLKHERTEVRIAVAQVIGSKKLRWGDELIGLLRDSEDDVRQAGRKALVQISGIDHGPDADATFTEREAALERWRDWWSRQKQGSAGK